MALHLKSTGVDFTDFGHGNVTPAGELLDDYEVGAWSAGDGTSTWSNTVTNQYYAKVGDRFDLYVYLQLSSGSGAHMKLAGMPFALGVYGASSVINRGNAASTNSFNYRWDSGATEMGLYASGGEGAAIGADEVDDTHQMFTYCCRT